MLDYSKLNKDYLEHQIILANIHLKVKNNRHSEKSDLNIAQIVQEFSNHSNVHLKRSVKTNSHLERSATSVTQIIPKCSKQTSATLETSVGKSQNEQSNLGNLLLAKKCSLNSRKK